MVQNNVAPRSKRDSRLLGKSTSPLVLKIEGTERDGQIIRVHAPKCLIGSAADCQLRLIAADVQPKHCVIYRGASGMIVKSWTRDTRVNGDTISEAWLRIGDRLSLGSLSFEVLADQQSESVEARQSQPTPAKSQRKLRKQSNRRIRNLLNVVRKQKDSFSELQTKFDETQQLVDSLLARETETNEAAPAADTESSTSRIERRKRHNQRARLLLNHVRDLISSNNTIQAELREQLEIKQNQVNEIRQELTTNADQTEEERARHRRLEADLQESEALIVHLKEQSSELQSREERLRERWISTRKLGKTRVKSILSHLRSVRDQLSNLDVQSAEEEEGASRLTKLRLAYDDASRELGESRDSLKDAESELAWTQQELAERQQHADELGRKIAELEQQLADAQAVSSSGMTEDEAAQHEAQLKQLHDQLDDAVLRGDDLKLQLDELRQQNLELHETLNQQRDIEENWKSQLDDARQQCLEIRRQLEDERRLAEQQGLDDEIEPTVEDESSLEHLRSMGILRETPPPTMPEESSFDAEEETYEEEPEAEEAFSEQASEEVESRAVNPITGLTSFPNFQFPEEDEPQEDYADSMSHETAADFKSEEPKKPARCEDEVAIDDYMQQLLARMRAKTGEPEPAPVKKPVQETVVAKPEPEPEEKPEPIRPITREEFIPSRYAPEQTSDIRRLRELANETAKAAIDSATLNRWESLCKSKLLVSMLALFAGIFMHYLSPSYLSISFAGACLAYVVTVFWWLQSAVIYQHVKTHRRERLEQRLNDEIITPHGLPHPSEHNAKD